MGQQRQVYSQSFLPREEGVRDTSEDFVIALHPNAPSRRQKDFHEHRPRPHLFSCMHFYETICATPPVHVDGGPAAGTEWAVEEQMFHCFRRRPVT